MEKKTIAVTGMACAGCAANVERRLGQIDGVAKASVNFAARTALVEYDPKKTSPKVMKEEIQKEIEGIVTEVNRNLAGYKKIEKVTFVDKPMEVTTTKKIKRGLVK